MARTPRGRHDQATQRKRRGQPAPPPPPDDAAKGRGWTQDPATGRMSGGNPGNQGGIPGRSGRKPNAFRRFWADLLDKDEVKQSIEKALMDSTHKDFAQLVKLGAAYGHGKPDINVNVNKTKRVVVLDMPARAGTLGDGNVDDTDDAAAIAALEARLDDADDDREDD